MVTINRIVRAFTREGAKARRFTPEMELKRALMNCLLWESQFYEDGVTLAERMAKLVPAVAPEKVAALAIEAREVMKLRHAPLLIVREMARHETHRTLVADTLETDPPVLLPAPERVDADAETRRCGTDTQARRGDVERAVLVHGVSHASRLA